MQDAIRTVGCRWLMVKPKREVCPTCHFNLLCESSYLPWNPFYCVNCREHSVALEISVQNNITTRARRVVPRGCRFVSRVDAVIKEKNYVAFVERRKAGYRELLARGRLCDAFQNFEMREFMCELCANRSQSKLNKELKDMR